MLPNIFQNKKKKKFQAAIRNCDTFFENEDVLIALSIDLPNEFVQKC